MPLFIDKCFISRMIILGEGKMVIEITKPLYQDSYNIHHYLWHCTLNDRKEFSSNVYLS